MKNAQSLDLPYLCGKDGCLKVKDHLGNCSRSPTEAWSILKPKDKDKINKAGAATPRGGAKNAYQNHVNRNSQVIIPFEKLPIIKDLSVYKDGYVIRVLPEQCFSGPGKLRQEFVRGGRAIIGVNAYVLYRNHEGYEKFKPLPKWKVRALIDSNGNPARQRGKGIRDTGHYVLRIASKGGGQKISKVKILQGPPQGIFATEYADADTDFLCRAVLAWQIIHTVDSPYVTGSALHLAAILNSIGMDDYGWYQSKGIMNKTFTTCPLCLRPIYYNELNDILKLGEESGLLNAADQVAGSTRSTIVNLFHFHPLVYEDLEHVPKNVAWGHATCNTKLGQRVCYTVQEVEAMNNKVAVIRGEEVRSFGWMSDNEEMIRSPNGAVWIQITKDTDFSRYQFLE